MPKAIIDWEIVKKLCAMQCTHDEIAGVCDVSKDTLYLRCKEDNGITFKEFMAKHKMGGRASLRRKQYQKAVVEGDVQMLKHLGKHYLDQHDKIDLGFDPDKPVVFELNMGKQLNKDQDDGESNSKEDTSKKGS